MYVYCWSNVFRGQHPKHNVLIICRLVVGATSFEYLSFDVAPTINRHFDFNKISPFPWSRTAGLWSERDTSTRWERLCTGEPWLPSRRRPARTRCSCCWACQRTCPLHRDCPSGTSCFPKCAAWFTDQGGAGVYSWKYSSVCVIAAVWLRLICLGSLLGKSIKIKL